MHATYKFSCLDLNYPTPFSSVIGWHGFPGPRTTYDISIEFEARTKFAVIWFKMYSTDHNEILHMPRQLL